jgi:hypothetical protein
MRKSSRLLNLHEGPAVEVLAEAAVDRVDRGEQPAADGIASASATRCLQRGCFSLTLAL